MSATIRTFRAPDAREALEAIKLELGPDAVILGTREVKGGFFRRAEVEVTAALPFSSPRAIAAYLARPQKAAEDGTEVPAQEPPGLAPSSSVRDELARLREELRSLKAPTPAEPQGPAQAVLTQLLQRGMEAELAQDVVQQTLERLPVQHSTAELVSALRESLSERVLTSRAPWLPDRRRVIGLIGPTGVGKTTTLAKIAAHALQQRQRVALVTVDTFRIGAVDQLAHYGGIMKVASYVAKNRGELEQCVSQCSGVDLVLIDTAGSSDPKAVQRQAEMVRGLPMAQLHLVASCAAGARDLAAVVERYRPLAPERLILTKLDEAACPAAFLSASFRLSRPIAALTDGQRVPEDIRAASVPELVELLLGPTPLSFRART